jgi:hypothetical protein
MYNNDNLNIGTTTTISSFLYHYVYTAPYDKEGPRDVVVDISWAVDKFYLKSFVCFLY